MVDVLRDATDGWTGTTITRTYERNRFGRALFESEAATLAAHGYTAISSAADDGPMDAWRTVAGAALSDGVSLLFGASRQPGHVVVTFARQAVGATGPHAGRLVSRGRGRRWGVCR